MGMRELEYRHRESDPDRLTFGDRVRMNALGLERHPKYGVREGVIVGMGSFRC